ncbi:MAG: hypothetical protein IT381_21550 [Deltaproteobacteria bacterium]|nr:hypothetical protein [Deltaproteobacteria bacterium]
MRARLGLILLVVACTKKPMAKPDPVAHATHPARTVAAHPLVTASTLNDRLSAAPAVLVAYLQEENALQGFAQTPRPHALSADERRLVSEALKTLPAEVLRLASRAVAAIYFVDDLGGTGWTETLRDDALRRSIIVFDASVLKKRANDWATDKERTVFALGADVRVLLAPEEANAEGSAFRYILLHELGHAIGTHTRAYPSAEDTPEETPFTKQSWRLEGRTFVPVQRLWPARLGFYGTAPPLPTTDVPAVYAKVKESAFPSLYACVGVEDDFAETFALYVHTVLMKLPHITLVSGDTAIIDCMEAPQCKEKRAIVSGLLR